MHATGSFAHESAILSSSPFRIVIRLVKQEVRRHLLVLVTREISLNDGITLEAQAT